MATVTVYESSTMVKHCPCNYCPRSKGCRVECQTFIEYTDTVSGPGRKRLLDSFEISQTIPVLRVRTG